MNRKRKSSNSAAAHEPGWLSIDLTDSRHRVPVDPSKLDSATFARHQKRVGTPDSHPSGWVMNLRHLLANVRDEAHLLSPDARHSLELAVQSLYGAGGISPLPYSDTAREVLDAQASPRTVLGHDPRLLIVGSTVEDLQTLFVGAWADQSILKLTLVRTDAAARAAVEQQAYDLMIYEYPVADLSRMEEFTNLYSHSACPPAIFLATDGSEELAAAAFKAGVYDYVPRRELTELVLRRTVIQSLRRARLEKELEAANRRLGELVNRDPLTGLHNRRYFEDRLGVEFARAQRYDQTLALALLDLDHFKEINDTYGHPAGDRVLIETAKTMLGLSRQIDLVARIGGEEFALLLPNTNRLGAQALVERIVEQVRARAVPINDHSVNVTISAGIAAFPEYPAQTRMKLFECADQALYKAKQDGRDRVAVFLSK